LNNEGIEWTSMSGAFSGCSNLTVPVNDAPDLSKVTSLNGMFRTCLSLSNEDFNNWDVSNVTNMSFMFVDTDSFNRDLGTWDVDNVTRMLNMLDFSDPDISNYEATLNS